MSKKSLAKRQFPLIVFLVLSFAWFLCVYQHISWLTVFERFGSWLISPEIHYTPMQVSGGLTAIFATIQMVILGTVASSVLLVNEENEFLKKITSIALGFGFIGLITIILAVFGVLYKVLLDLIIPVSIIGLILLKAFCLKRKHEFHSVWSFFKNIFSIWKPRRPAIDKNWLVLVLPIGLMLLFYYYSALFTPIVHWDATVYHAVIPSIMYNYHGMPLIAGTSVGLEMSANYPPLYYALGAFYYIQVGGVEEFYLKAISPTMALLTILVIYRIGKLISGETCGKISALLLSITPLFILYSMYVTSYMMYVFFMTTSFLFMFLAFEKAKAEYWILCGIFYGFSLLSNYQSLILAPLFLVVFLHLLLKERGCGWHSLEYFISIVAVAGVWYLRNLVLLGNPAFPLLYEVFGGKYVNSTMHQLIFDSIQYCSTTSYFKIANPSITEYLGTFIFDFQHFPAFCLLTFTGIGLALWKGHKMKNWIVLLVWAFWPSLLILSRIEWSFPRAFLITLPAFALFTAFSISEAINQLAYKTVSHKKTQATSCYFWSKKLVKNFIVAILFLCLLFPGLAIAITGKSTFDAPFAEPPSDPLFYVKNPGNLTIGEWYHGVKTEIWKFLNDNLKEGEKVATFESKLYYIKGGDYKYFFPLDGWEASELYQITDPAEMVQFLKEKNVKYIFDSPWTHGALWSYLPLTREDPGKNYTNFLGTVWFPVAFDPIPPLNNTEGGTVYHVGPIMP